MRSSPLENDSEVSEIPDLISEPFVRLWFLVKLITNFLKRLFTKRKKNIMPTIQQILAAIQADVANLATYVAGLNPGTVPANIAAALVAVQAAQTQLNADSVANPFVLATVVTDVSNLLTAVNALAAAVASPSTP
jgi:hypothetical protein